MPKKEFPKLIVILGPTASGKTELAVKLAKKFNGEIVNADSRQIYIGMDIGTAKPKKNQIARNFAHGESAFSGKNQNRKSKIKKMFIYKNVPHYLISMVEPDQSFTLSEYQKLAMEAVKDIIERGKIPFLVGGTGLYIQSVVDNLKIPEIPPNEKIRKHLEKLSAKQLLNKLKKIDPKTFNTIDKNNRRRVVRALEVCLVSGKLFSSLKGKRRKIFNSLQIGINAPKDILHQKINKRVEGMIARGLAKEVRKLNKKYSFKLPAMSGIGYKEFELYFNKKRDLKETIDLIKKNTRDYSRRQITWFKKIKRIKWVKDYGRAEKLIKKFLNI